MKKVIKTLAKVTAAVMTGSALTILGLVFGLEMMANQANTDIVYLSTEFSDELVDPISAFIEPTKDAKLLVINSPGGSVDTELNLVSAMAANGKIDTFVPSFAASAGASTFLAGKRRFAMPGAVILFHGAMLGEGLTQGDMEALVEQARKNIMLQSEDVYQRLTAQQHLAQLEGGLNVLRHANTVSVDMFEPLIQASNGELTRDMIIHEVFGDFKSDVILTAKRLHEIGVVTDIGHPDYQFYRDN